MLDIIKTRLEGIGYEVQEADLVLINYMIDSVGQYIMNFCNLSSVPDELKDVWADAVTGEFLYQKKAIGALGDTFDFSAVVTGIKEGDTQVSLSDGGAESLEAQFDALISKMRTIDVTQLLRFRRLVW